ncbi:uncharacterized protein A1O9_05050 [Exophiala aquamarina CBS 119918]|uniref:Uncharacterized protein n=1 Tax=Exophiala aquamarina CBS 119918 TaxID=1182545 RepID=A0A072PX76_9EURO|nr:uncharacterized protein A1O9_05050 [Exophiala aquamarina CBS 119918]KEF60200.1 hypothetical protein A1O9_05050 [Exophiala aquamarina CBS 119918]
MSSSSWQDRRFMFPSGKEVHQGSPGYTPAEKEKPPTIIPTSTSPPASTEKVIPSWEGDRRFMFPSGKQLHEPARRLSASSGTSGKAAESTTKAAPASATAASPQTAIANAIAGRRRSSASSQGGMFSGLMARRGSDEHNDRRQSWEDMKSPGGVGGLFSGLLNKPSEKK